MATLPGGLAGSYQNASKFWLELTSMGGFLVKFIGRG